MWEKDISPEFCPDLVDIACFFSSSVEGGKKMNLFSVLWLLFPLQNHFRYLYTGKG